MLEVLNAPKRYGDGIMGSSAYRGTFCYISGFQNAAADIGGTNGMVVLKVPYSSAQVFQAKYLVDKIYYDNQYNDTSDSVDKLLTGQTVRYFDEGEFISNRVGTYTFMTAANLAAVRTSSAVGANMYPGGINATALGVSSRTPFLFVATGPGQGKGGVTGNAGIGMGYLLGTAAASITTNRSKAVVGRVLGYLGASSADFRVRFRIENSAPASWF